MTNEQIIEQFYQLGKKASIHFADDSGREWHLGEKYKREAMALYNAHPGLEPEFDEVAGRFLWSLKLALLVQEQEARGDYDEDDALTQLASANRFINE